jgi:hypothetical protein
LTHTHGERVTEWLVRSVVLRSVPGAGDGAI